MLTDYAAIFWLKIWWFKEEQKFQVLTRIQFHNIMIHENGEWFLIELYLLANNLQSEAIVESDIIYICIVKNPIKACHNFKTI